MTHGEKRTNSRKKRKEFRKGTVSFFDRLFRYIYHLLKNGWVGALFTSYKSGGARSRGSSRLKASLSSAFNNGYTAKVSKKLSETMLKLQLRFYGTFLVTFGVYTFLYEIADNFVFSQSRYVSELFFSVLLIMCSIPFIVSEKNLYEALTSSVFGRFISTTAGTGAEELRKTGTGKVSHGFILGVAAGSFAFLSSPSKVALTIAFLVLLWIILSKPELGIVAAAFLMPFSTAEFSAALLVAVAFSFGVKVIRGKRYTRFETIDVSVLGILLTVFLGGMVAILPGTYKEAMMYVLLITVYFLTVNLLKTKVWLDCTTVALILGLSVSCLMRTVGFVGDLALGDVSVKLAGIFEGTLTEQIIAGDGSTASVISIIAIPITVSLFMRPAFSFAKGYALVAIALFAVPCISDATSYSLIAVFVSTLLLFLIYTRKTLYAVLSGVALMPVAALLFSSAYTRVSAYVVREAEASMSFRRPLWDNAFSVLSDFLFGGIGFGEECFSKISPLISDSGECVPHCYNTYLQLWIETGIFGLIIFLVFAWLLVCSAFTVFRRVDVARRNPALRTRGLRINSPDSLESFISEKKGSNIKLSVNQYSISRRIGGAAPLCSIIGMLVYGFYDYIWYDEKVFFMFWLVAGICSAYVRSARKEIDDIELSYLLREERAGAWETDIN